MPSELLDERFLEQMQSADAIQQNNVEGSLVAQTPNGVAYLQSQALELLFSIGIGSHVFVQIENENHLAAPTPHSANFDFGDHAGSSR